MAEYELVQTLSQSASSSHHHRLSLQRAPETERPWTRPALVIAQQPVAEMPQDDAAWLLPSCALGVTGGWRVRSFLVSFPVTAAHVVSVWIAWPWADSRRQDHTRLWQEHSLEGSANWTAPATGLAAETPDDGKDLECTSLSEAFGWAERAISEVMHPLLVRRSSLLPAQLFAASPTIER